MGNSSNLISIFSVGHHVTICICECLQNYRSCLDISSDFNRDWDHKALLRVEYLAWKVGRYVLFFPSFSFFLSFFLSFIFYHFINVSPFHFHVWNMWTIGTNIYIYIYIFLLNTLSGGKSYSVAPGVVVLPWATETVLSPWLAADEARVSHVLSHVVWWKKTFIYIYIYKGTLGGLMVSRLDKQTFSSEFDSHWVPHSCVLKPHLSKKLKKLLLLLAQ